MSRVYECIGGPYDGETFALEGTSCELRVALLDRQPVSWKPPTGAALPVKPRIREGRYVLERHRIAGYVLRWEGEV